MAAEQRSRPATAAAAAAAAVPPVIFPCLWSIRNGIMTTRPQAHRASIWEKPAASMIKK